MTDYKHSPTNNYFAVLDAQAQALHRSCAEKALRGMFKFDELEGDAIKISREIFKQEESNFAVNVLATKENSVRLDLLETTIIDLLNQK